MVEMDYQNYCGTMLMDAHELLAFRFNALDFLGKMRGKRVMLVGDSIMRNQWESLVCLVEAVIPVERKLLSSDGQTTAFQALVR